MMRGFGGSGSGRPLLAHSSDKSRRPPSPSKHGKGRGWIQRAQSAGVIPSGSGLVLLVPLLFFALAIIACVWLLHGAIVAPSMPQSGPAPSVQTTSIRPNRRSLLPPIKPIQKDANAAAALPVGATDAAPVVHLPSLLESSLAEIDAAPAPPPRPQSVEQSLRWLSHWLSLRASMDALSIDLRSHFPASAAPEPIRVMTPLPGGQVRVGWNANAGTAALFHPPPRPLPPQQGWAAGLPVFPELFLRDSFSAFLLLFPLPHPAPGRGAADTAASAAPTTAAGYEGVWDLRPLMGGTGATAAAPGSTADPNADAQASGQTAAPRGFPFPRLLDAHPSVASTALDDLLRMRSILRVAARTQGTRVDPRTGEEPGKVAHQLPGKDMLSTTGKGAARRTVARSTRYASADSTALFVLAAVHHFHACADLSLLEELLPALGAALSYISAHVELASGLVREQPDKFLAHAAAEQGPDDAANGSSLDYALKVTYWKDSVLAKRNAPGTGGGPAYPVAYFLLQAQSLAALRALRSLRGALASFSPPGSEASVPMAALLRRWDGLVQAAQPDLGLDGLIERVRGAMHTYFFRRASPDHAGDSNSASASGADSSHSDFPPPVAQPAAGSCPLFGLDRLGSLGLDPAAAGSSAAIPDELRTSDFLHGLYYLEREDLTREELEAWASAAVHSSPSPPADAADADGARTERQQQQQAEEDGAAAPWEPSCFQGLETPLGYASSNLDRTPSSPTGSRPTLRREGEDSDEDDQPLRLGDADRALNYHHRALWPMEQAFIHAGARRFQLGHVARVAGSFFHRFEQALLRRREVRPEGMEPFPEYFLPRAFATRPSPAIIAAGQSLTLEAGRAAPGAAAGGGAGVRREVWVSQGAPTQLWTAAAWNYWIQAQGQRAHVLASKNAQANAAGAVAAGRAATTVSSSRCETDASAVLRGVPLSERARYCPSASTLSASASAATTTPRAWPASVFACLDGSALLWLSAVNDNYCDCTDGSDERGTGACAHSDEEHSFQAPTFECESMDRGGGAGAARASVARIPVSMVDDGVCDCCDGSDETSGIVQCKNTCTTIRDRRSPMQSAWQM